MYRLGVVLCVWLRSYRVYPALLPYQGKLPVYEGVSPCSPPVAVHRDRGPTPWHSLTLTGDKLKCATSTEIGQCSAARQTVLYSKERGDLPV
jgi:hypothetical protein